MTTENPNSEDLAQVEAEREAYSNVSFALGKLLGVATRYNDVKLWNMCSAIQTAIGESEWAREGMPWTKIPRVPKKN